MTDAIKTAATAANDDAPRAKRTLAAKDIVGTLTFERVAAATDENGLPYATFEDAEIATGDGRTLRRTVAAHETYGLIHQAAATLQPLVVTLRHVGGELRIVGVAIDGAMRFTDNRLAKAA